MIYTESTGIKLALVSIAMETIKRTGAVTSASSRLRLGTSGDGKRD